MAAPMTSARSLAQHPEDDRRRPRIAVAAGLREVASAGDAQARGERLQQNRHQIRQHDHAEEGVAVARAAGEVRGPVARVHVADRDEVSRSGKREQLAPEARAVRDGDRSVDLGEADIRGGQAPAT